MSLRHVIGGALALALALGPWDARATRVQVVSAGHNIGHAGDVDLRYAESDAATFAEVMRSLGDVPSTQISMVLGEEAPALRQALLDANARLRSADPAAGDDTALVVYYSGHADATGLHLGDTTLPFEELRSIVTGSPARVRLLVVDSCRSGGVTRVKGVTPGPDFEITLDDRLEVEGLAIITSSAAGEDSQESDRLQGSFFSHHLVNGLRGAADDDGNGDVTLEEAYAYAYSQTLRSSGQTLNLQHPTYEYDIKGHGAFVLTRLNRDRRRTAQLTFADTGRYLIIEGGEAGRDVRELRVARAGQRVVLPPGRYFIQRRAARHYREYEVQLTAGQSADLSDVPHRTVAYARLVRKGGGDRRSVHGLQLLGGVRGEVLGGEGPTPQWTLSYGADLPWLSLGARVRYATGAADTGDGIAMSRHEVGLGLVIQRYVDLPWFSLAFGVAAEGVLHLQRFESTGVAPDRQAWGFGLDVFLALERELWSGWTLRLEGGPRTEIYEKVTTQGGAPVGTALATPFTWRAAAGFAWRF